MNKRALAKILILIIIICIIFFAADVIRGLQLRKDGEDHFTAKVTFADKEKITFEITDSGTTPYEKGETYAVLRKNVTATIPDLVLWDYIRVECNCGNDLLNTDPPELPIVFYISKTDAEGNVIYD